MAPIMIVVPSLAGILQNKNQIADVLTVLHRNLSTSAMNENRGEGGWYVLAPRTKNEVSAHFLADLSSIA